MKFRLLLLTLGLLQCTSAAVASGYVLSGSGAPVLDASGMCIRTGSWMPAKPVPGCDPMPIARPDRISTPDRIVLLPDPQGVTGAVVVRSAAGQLVLNQAYASVQAASSGALESVTETAASVEARYGGLIKAQAPRPVTFVLRFESGSATRLSADSVSQVEALKAVLATWPAPQITVIGHTDRVGSPQSNDALSLQRAQVVVELLVKQGINLKQIESAGRGEREPLVATNSGVANATNRRVEVTIR